MADPFAILGLIFPLVQLAYKAHQKIKECVDYFGTHAVELKRLLEDVSNFSSLLNFAEGVLDDLTFAAQRFSAEELRGFEKIFGTAAAFAKATIAFIDERVYQFHSHRGIGRTFTMGMLWKHVKGDFDALQWRLVTNQGSLQVLTNLALLRLLIGKQSAAALNREWPTVAKLSKRVKGVQSNIRMTEGIVRQREQEYAALVASRPGLSAVDAGEMLATIDAMRQAQRVSHAHEPLLAQMARDADERRNAQRPSSLSTMVFRPRRRSSSRSPPPPTRPRRAPSPPPDDGGPAFRSYRPAGVRPRRNTAIPRSARERRVDPPTDGEDGWQFNVRRR